MIIDINIWIFNPFEWRWIHCNKGPAAGDSGIRKLHPVGDNHRRHLGAFHSAKSNNDTAIVPRQTGTWRTI